jgi:hypothetical protein
MIVKLRISAVGDLKENMLHFNEMQHGYAL